MPRLNVRIAALAAALIVIVGAVVLYVIHVRAVHAAQEPPSLAALAFDPAPVTMPDVAFADASGAHHPLSAFKGRYVLLNLWATWCAPCVKELPALARLQAALPTAKLTVVTVNVGRGSVADTAAFLKAHGAASLPVYVDSNTALIRAFGAVGLPLSVLIDPQGREVARAAGPADWDDAAAIAYFKALTAS
ncbi:MAG TPA: TlpA disulfide reductase family protein [Rhizomicrobium sp.]|jgi:thiol-disulfide isomerase/thioredoxin|nr:TlpA disulfide reductase family protein [Rhizomicrobium sp.]